MKIEDIWIEHTICLSSRETEEVGIFLILCPNENFEGYYVSIKDSFYFYSLVDNNPIEDKQGISDEDQIIINQYINKVGGIESFLPRIKQGYIDYSNNNEIDKETFSNKI